jgi:hypothetical protein
MIVGQLLVIAHTLIDIIALSGSPVVIVAQTFMAIQNPYYLIIPNETISERRLVFVAIITWHWLRHANG